jgi:hypothetical protein
MIQQLASYLVVLFSASRAFAPLLSHHAAGACLSSPPSFPCQGIHEASHEAFGLHLWFRVDAAATNFETTDDDENNPQQRARAAAVAALAHALRHHPALAGFLELVEEEARAAHGGASASAAAAAASAAASSTRSSTRSSPRLLPDDADDYAGVLGGPVEGSLAATPATTAGAGSANDADAYVASDPRLGEQSHYAAIAVPQAWALTAGAARVVVRCACARATHPPTPPLERSSRARKKKHTHPRRALNPGGIRCACAACLLVGVRPSAGFTPQVQVVDSGVDGTHPDLQRNRWTNPGNEGGSGGGAGDAGVGGRCRDGVDNDGNGFVDDCWGYNHADSHGGVDLLGDGR